MRESRAEIVHTNRASEIVEREQRARSGSRRPDDVDLTDLDPHAAPLHPVLGAEFGEIRGKRLVPQLLGGQVDRDEGSSPSVRPIRPARSANTARIARRPIGMISEVASATGMKASGLRTEPQSSSAATTPSPP